MKTIGIILLCLQGIALLGGLTNGSLTNMLTQGIRGIFSLVGFCLPGIIGALLLIKAKKK